MIPIRFFLKFLALTAACLLASCAKPGDLKPVMGADGKMINPYQVGTYDHFKAEPSYPKTFGVWKNEELLSSTHSSNSRIVIDEKQQRGMLLNGDEVVMDYPICSGRKSHPTPKGTFPILEKIVDKRSNKYGKIYDAEGTVVVADADATKDPIPEGGRFEGAAMRYWMRLTWDGVGHHIGPIRRYPASHACIRGPSAVMPIVYSKVKLGTKITVL